MIAAPTRVSVEEYLETSYEPECEYIDGELIPKAMGTNDHARLQFKIARLLYPFEEAGLCEISIEQSLRIRDGEILIPDVCLLPPCHGETGVVGTPAILCIEVLSPSDRFSYTVKKCEDYIRWGAHACWVLDPVEKKAWTFSGTTLCLVPPGGVLRAGSIELPLSNVW